MKRIQYALTVLFITSFFCYGQTKKDAVFEPMSLVAPEYLKVGDRITIVAPAGILIKRKELIEKAKQLAESWGLKVFIGAHVFDQNHHFAGTDKERADDFQKALDDPRIKAIWCARGGYGSARILDRLDVNFSKGTPKWIVGYSDVTALHSHFHNLGLQTIHAMMCTSLSFDPLETKQSIQSLKKALFGEVLRYKIKSNPLNRNGKSEGLLVGGNLSLLQSMLASTGQLNTKGKILFIEEIGEYKYHIDRMLQSLKRAGYFDHCKGLIVGGMTNVKKNTTPWGSSIEQLILDVVAAYDFPVLFDFPAGHDPDNRALILGRKIKMSVKKEESEVLFESS